MNDAISEAVNKLTDITDRYPIDWSAFDDVLNSLTDINAFDEADEETILSEYIVDGDFKERGELLATAVRHFLSCGYDVRANEGRNGGLALSALCFSSYDRNVLETAKLLMNAGAPVIYRSADDEADEAPRGLLGSIGWHYSGAWAVYRDFSWANILGTYYSVAEANVSQKDYNSIRCFSDCIGLELSAVSADINDCGKLSISSNSVRSFDRALVMWFGSTPLVISPYVEFVVDPIYVSENRTALVDVSGDFSPLIGGVLLDVRYCDSTICYLEFSSGYRFVLASRPVAERKRSGSFEIRPVEQDIKIESLKIDMLCGLNGVTYASTAQKYDETALAIFSGDEAYLLYPTLGKDDKHYMKLFHCAKELLCEYTRLYPVSTPNEIACFYENMRLTGIRFDYGDKFLYFKSAETYKIELVLSKDRFDARE